MKSNVGIRLLLPLIVALLGHATSMETIAPGFSKNGSEVGCMKVEETEFDSPDISNITVMASPKAIVIWPGLGGRIPYTIGTGFSQADLNNLNAAFRDYEAKTCIRWEPRGSQAEYVLFQGNPSDGGSSCATTQVNVKNPKTVTFWTQGDCRDVHVMQHEMGHVLGFPHEEDRSDRDNYVSAPSGCDLGGKFPDPEPHLYDYLSVMHAECNACPRPRLSGVPYCGQRCPTCRLSVLDAEKVNDLYGCGGCFSYRFRRPQNTVPSAVFPGGNQNGAITYVCRGYTNGHIHVGVASGNLASCWLPNGVGGEAGMSSEFEVLTDPGRNLRWVQSTGVIPTNAIPGGRSATHETVYIGRCNYPTNSVTPGTILANSPRQLRVSYGGTEYVGCQSFEILTCGS